VIQPWAGLLVGFSGAFAYYAQSYVTENIFHIDDPLDAAALHMGAGFWGMLMAGVLADPAFVGDDGQEGLFYGGGKQLGYQIMAILAYGTWAFGMSAIMFGSLKYLGLFRVDKEVELMGLDDHHHGGYSYRIKHHHDDETVDLGDTTKHVGNSGSDSDEIAYDNVANTKDEIEM